MDGLTGAAGPLMVPVIASAWWWPARQAVDRHDRR